MTAPRIRLFVESVGCMNICQRENERNVIVFQLEGETARPIGNFLVPETAIPQLGALGVLVGLGVFSSLEIVGADAPPVYELSAREARLLKIAAKVLA